MTYANPEQPRQWRKGLRKSTRAIFVETPTNPLTRMQALGVLMNKLLHVWWALIQQQTFYQPDFSTANA